MEDQEAKRRKERRKKQTTQPTKISHKTLDKVLKKQATLDKERQVINAQQRICSEGGKHIRTPTKIRNSPAPITQDNDNADTLAQEVSPYPEDTWEEEEPEPSKLRRPPRFQTNFMTHSAASISQAALQSFIGNSFLQELQWSMETNVDPPDLEQVANSVVHPVTKETITKHKILIADPVTREVWMKAMAKKIGRLAQGYKDTKCTNTVEFMNLENIRKFQRVKLSPTRALLWIIAHKRKILIYASPLEEI